MSSTSGGGETAEAATGLFGLALGGSSDEDSADEAPEKLAYDAAAATYVPKQCEPLWFMDGSQPDFEQAEVRHARLVALVSMRRFAEALPLAEQMLEDQPNHSKELLDEAARCALGCGRLDRALAYAERRRDLDSAIDCVGQVMYAKVLEAAGRASDAVAELESACAKTPDVLFCWQRLADLRLRLLRSTDPALSQDYESRRQAAESTLERALTLCKNALRGANGFVHARHSRDVEQYENELASLRGAARESAGS